MSNSGFYLINTAKLKEKKKKKSGEDRENDSQTKIWQFLPDP